MKWNRVFRALLITLAFGVPGCLLSQWIGSNLNNGRWAWWHSLGTPPGGAIRFVHVEIRYIDGDSSRHNRTAVVYVETSRKQVFHCCAQEEEWQQGNFREDKNGRVFGNCQPAYDLATHPAFSRFRGKVIDCTRVIWSMEWIANEDFFVILEDGSVWKWHYYTGLDALSLAYTCGLPLAIIGLGWGVIALIRYTRRRSAMQQG